ncbi:hypothetical protein [Cupriavidus basilensis]
MEGVNNRIKVFKPKTYGFRDTTYFFLKIREFPRKSVKNLFLRSRSTRRLSAASHCGALPACSLQLLASVPCVQAASFLHGDSSELRLPVFRHVCPIKLRTRLKLAKKCRQEAAVMHFCFQFFTIPPISSQIGGSKIASESINSSPI